MAYLRKSAVKPNSVDQSSSDEGSSFIIVAVVFVLVDWATISRVASLPDDELEIKVRELVCLPFCMFRLVFKA